jgi:hypothetical protein
VVTSEGARGETNGLPQLVNVLCEVGEKAVSG